VSRVDPTSSETVPSVAKNGTQIKSGMAAQSPAKASRAGRARSTGGAYRFHVARSSCAWRLLPEDRFSVANGLWLFTLNEPRTGPGPSFMTWCMCQQESEGRKVAPTTLIIDSQSILMLLVCAGYAIVAVFIPFFPSLVRTICFVDNFATLTYALLQEICRRPLFPSESHCGGCVVSALPGTAWL
jgi:hypothetical protein